MKHFIAPDFSGPKRYVAWHFELSEAGARTRLDWGRCFYDDVTHARLRDVKAILESLKRNGQVISHAD